MAKKTSSTTKKDFEKQKVKPGKLKPGAVNKTDTSFTAKRLNLKDQHLSAVSTLPSLCTSFLRHYSPRNRKDALLAILRLLGKNGEVVKGCMDVLTPVLGKCVAEVECRKEAAQLYSLVLKCDKDTNWLGAIWPHPLLAHFLLACTNVDPQVHLNAIQLLALFPNDLLLPVADQLLFPLSRLLKPTELEKPSSPLIALLTRILALLSQEEEPRAIFEILWTPTLVLPSPLIPSKRASSRPTMSESLVKQVITRVTETMLLPWTEVAYLFLGQKSPARSDAKEVSIYENVLAILQHLYDLHCISEREEQWASFCKLVPLKMFNSLHKCKSSFALCN